MSLTRVSSFVKEEKTRLLKNNFGEKKKVDMWWCGEAAPPHIPPLFLEGKLFQHSQKTSRIDTSLWLGYSA